MGSALLQSVRFQNLFTTPVARMSKRVAQPLKASHSGDTFTLRFGATNPTDTKAPSMTTESSTPAPKVHMVNGVPYKTADGTYQMVVEIPAGTDEKWQTDPVTGEFYHDKENGVPRIINFIPYPMNYGIVPQTLLPKKKGGDGDPTDIVTLAPGQPRGTVNKVKVIGAIKFAERGEIDTKIVAILPEGPFKDINDLPELLMKYPGALEMVRMWFEGYKGPGSFLFQGYSNREEAVAFIEETHQDWVEAMQAGG